MSVAEELFDATEETLKKAESGIVEASLALGKAAGNIVSGIEHLGNASPSEKAELIEGVTACVNLVAGEVSETEDPNGGQDLREIVDAVRALERIGCDSESSHRPAPSA